MQEEEDEVDKVFHHQKLLYVLKIVRFELISKYYNDLLIKPFGINKIQKVMSRKYY